MTDIARLPGAFNHHWNWQLAARCRDLDSAVFFHPPGERGEARGERAENAKRICHTCPVQQECLRHALQVREPYGVWGGLAEEERAALLGPVRSARTARAA
ncbi:WhiB family transcriptional regulator [Kitasatospora sp. NPDC002040]|uniref:WhiB family transcriptional regulator n=1 Tax=Kitasatospora sp. NPDC002040 TaxID=3154661 RepID=UPI0033264AB2